MNFFRRDEEWELVLVMVTTITALLLLSNCYTNQNGIKETYYPLIDTRLKLHKYRENIQWIIFPKNNKRTEYCSTHYVWENIQPIYRPTGNGEYRWQYRVTKNNGKPWK